MLDRIQNEPVLVLAVVMTLVILLVEFGLSLTDTQQTAIEAFVAAVLGLIARAKVTPTRKL